MITTVSTVSVIAYIVFFVLLRRKWVQQEIAFLAIFLAGTAIIGELDVLLPIYFVFSFIPFAGKIRKLSRFTMGLSVYYIIYLFVGLLFQNSTRTLVTFIAKIWQFVVFFIIIDEDIVVNEFDYKKSLWVIMIIETVLGVYLFLNSTMRDSLTGLVRLVNNGQPITGNISTFSLLITAFCYVKHRGNTRIIHWLLFANIYMLIWIVLSGTRGYTMEYLAVMIPIIFDYFANGEVGRNTRNNRIIIGIILGISAVLLVFVVPGILGRLSSVLRLNSTVGIRTFENAAVREYLSDASLHEVIFGIGLGGKGSEHIAMREALYKQFSLGMWNRRHYLNESGTLFHSLYANITMCLGLLGLFVTALTGVKIWKKISVSCCSSPLLRRLLHLFLLSFFLMNYYRWSADCGIAEMILLALVLKLVDAENRRIESVSNC